MNKQHILAIAFSLVASTLSAQTTIVSRPPIEPFSPDNGALSGETDRFGDFSGLMRADYFELQNETTLSTLTIYRNDEFGTFAGGDPFSIHIFQDDNGQPDGFPYDGSGEGELGSDGIVYFPLVEEGSPGFEYIFDGSSNSRIYFTVDVTAANGGVPITLPAGSYWLSTVHYECCDSISPDQSRIEWQQSAVSSGVNSKFTTFDSFGFPNNQWFEAILVDATLAWELTGQEAAALLGDVNMDGLVNLLDVAPFVELVSNGGFQAEADTNEDGMVNLLDVGPFVDLLAN